jgi:pimeloyl-ACP methyl ester carboxylesterase
LQPAAIPLLRPLVGTDQRTRDLQRFVVAFDNKHTRQIESQLRALRAPTLIVWGTDDVYFPVKWAHWLTETIPGAKPPVELEGARIFFPEERAEASIGCCAITCQAHKPAPFGTGRRRRLASDTASPTVNGRIAVRVPRA